MVKEKQRQKEIFDFILLTDFLPKHELTPDSWFFRRFLAAEVFYLAIVLFQCETIVKCAGKKMASKNPN